MSSTVCYIVCDFVFWKFIFWQNLLGDDDDQDFFSDFDFVFLSRFGFQVRVRNSMDFFRIAWMTSSGRIHPHPSICLQDFVGDSRPPSGLFWSDTLSSKPSKATTTEVATTGLNPLRCGGWGWRWWWWVGGGGLFGDGRKHE